MDSILGFLDLIPEETIAITVYLVGSLIILICWYVMAKQLPRLLGGLTWVILFAVLFTPTVPNTSNASISPATFGVIFGILTKDYPVLWANLSLILFVIGLGCILGYLWSKYTANKAKIEHSKKVHLYKSSNKVRL